MMPIQFSWPEGKAGAFTTSYDDGVKEDRRLVSVLNRFGIRGTWNLNSSRVAEAAEQNGPVALPELRTLYAGHEVAAHGFTHPRLERIPEERMLLELCEDRRRLEAGTGYPVKGMSLPFGTYDRRVLAMLSRCGIVHCRTTRASSSFGLPADFLEWHPTCHHNADLAGLWQQFSACKDADKLFYLWGHSYEFDRQNNWEIIERFAETVGAAREAGWLWCATNMEICEYVTAWRELWCSLDGRSFRNTRGVPVWFTVARKLLKVAPGETVVCE
jgi:peptidoglycan-N-acetylglucosamine deacetylase